MDHVGPQYPATERGNLYMFTVICPFSGWLWAIPCATKDGEEAAQLLAERVIFDIAGVPILMCSDRARSFTGGVMSYLEKKLGIKVSFGSSLHPQSQGAIEKPHATYKRLCKEFMEEFNDQWDMVAPLFQWTVRTSQKVYNGNYTPYEIVTGLKPRLPLDELLGHPTVAAQTTQDQYVDDLIGYLKKVHKAVAEAHTRVREHEQEVRYRKYGDSTWIDVGDYVLRKVIPRKEKNRSVRFAHTRDTRLYQVYSLPSSPKDSKTAWLMDAATGSTDCGFAQPVSIEHLVPVEILPLAHHHKEKSRILSDGRYGEVQATCVDGRVHVLWEDTQRTTVEDLSRLPHEFVV